MRLKRVATSTARNIMFMQFVVPADGYKRHVWKTSIIKKKKQVAVPSVSDIIYLIKLYVAPHGCKTWCFALRKEHRSKVSENWMHRKIFGPRRVKFTGRRKLHNENPIICTFHQTLKGTSNQGE
jgi:hypothetical protein